MFTSHVSRLLIDFECLCAVMLEIGFPLTIKTARIPECAGDECEIAPLASGRESFQLISILMDRAASFEYIYFVVM
jgi:hypothetical protein